MNGKEKDKTKGLLQEIEAQYDDLNTRFPFPFVGKMSDRPLESELLKKFIALCSEAGPVIDMGCGTGRTVKALGEKGLETVGLDLSGKAIALARKIMPEGSFVHGNLLSTPFPEKSAGGIVCLFSLIHLERGLWARALNEFFRVLIPGAPLLLSCYKGDGEQIFVQEEGAPLNIGTTLFTEKELLGLLREAGFEVIEKRERDSFPGEYRGERIFFLASRP